LDSFQWRILNEASTKESHNDGYNVDGQLELQELGDRVVNIATPHDSLNDTAKVIVRQDNVGSLFGHVRSSDALKEGNGIRLCRRKKDKK
jgi:hypothetical protein